MEDISMLWSYLVFHSRFQYNLKDTGRCTRCLLQLQYMQLHSGMGLKNIQVLLEENEHSRFD